MLASLPFATCGEARQIDPRRLEPAAFVELERAGVARKGPDHDVVDAELRELLVDGVEQRAPIPSLR
jgi:hypothetical protein